MKQSKPVLIGSPRHIKLWKEIYGDAVEYVEAPELPRKGEADE